MGERRRCNWCGRQAAAISDEGARALGWLVGATAMCPVCAGPEVCTRCQLEECGCDSAHVMPCDDGVEHVFTDCPCGPDVQPIKREDGSVGWLVVHHSLDGRELVE